MDIEREVNKEFKVFHRQVDMFEYQKKFLPHGRCFSFEMPNPYMTQGRRKFFVAELTKFWVWYRNFYRLPRHFYEIIQEGLPCRLYFDLEFNKADNPDLDENKALSDFLVFVCSLVKETYGLEITEKSFILLDSTTEKKFSVHATCHFPNDCLFPSNVAMREFIAKLTQKMSDLGVGIVKKENEETFICDPAVYTKNRSFRILLSSKCGKDIIFKYRNGCKFYDQVPGDDRQIFLDSLIVPPDYSKSPLLDVIENKGRVLKRNRILQRVETNTRAISDFTVPLDVETIDSGTPPSPFPELDEYVREFNTQFNKSVEIRSWTLLYVRSSSSRRVQYQLNNCRYCLRIQREHQSNNVYWTCQLDREWMFQRCFDYDCREFVSNFYSLPSSLIEQIKPKFDTAFPKSDSSAPKLLPPKKAVRPPPIQKKLFDSFNDSALDHELEELLKSKKGKKRVHPGGGGGATKKVKLPVIPKKAEDSFYSTKTDDELFELLKKKRENNAKKTDPGEGEASAVPAAPDVIELSDDDNENDVAFIAEIKKITSAPKVSVSNLKQKKSTSRKSIRKSK